MCDLDPPPFGRVIRAGTYPSGLEGKIAAAKAELAELPDPKTGPVVRAFAILADFNHAHAERHF